MEAQTHANGCLTPIPPRVVGWVRRKNRSGGRWQFPVGSNPAPSQHEICSTAVDDSGSSSTHAPLPPMNRKGWRGGREATLNH